MVVQSGNAPYDYVGPLLNFSAKNGNIAPSAILYEEAMFALKAEYNRVRVQASGFEPTNRDMAGADYDPDFPEDSFKFVNQGGSFVKYVNFGLSGTFDPNPSGKYLDGTLTPQSGTASGIQNLPGMWHSVDYIKDMQDVMLSVHTRIVDYIGDEFEVAPSDVYRDWFKFYKGYNDGWAESGMFYEESGVMSEFNGDFWDEIKFEVNRQKIGNSGIFDRHLDEVRIQPMPFILGNSGSITQLGPNGEPPWEGAGTLSPVQPQYFRSDGTIASGWDNITLRGDVLVSGLSIRLSGLAGNTPYLHQTWTPETDSFFENFPRSGSFTVGTSIPEGWYKIILTASGSDNNIDVLFPWGTGLDNSSLISQWPRKDDWFGQAGTLGLIVTDTIHGLQDHEPNPTRTAFKPPQSESGMFWYALSPSGGFGGSATAKVVDFPSVQPFVSGVGEGVWGHDLRSKWGNGTATKVRAGGWIYDRSNDQIVRTMSSGGHDRWSNFSFQTDYINGSGVINVFEPRTIDLVSVNLVGTANGLASEVFRAYGLSAITFDGTDFICNGYLNWDGIPSGVPGNSGAYLKIDTSFNLTDAVQYGATSGGFRLHWARDTSEFLGVSNTNSTQIPGVGSGGYHVVDLTWGDITNGSGSYTVARHTMTLTSGVSGLLNLDGIGPQDRTPRIIDFHDSEDGSDTLYCMFWAYAAGALSGVGNTWRRWMGRVNTDGGHPYQIEEAWSIGNDSDRTSLGSNIQNAEFSMYMDSWEY